MPPSSTSVPTTGSRPIGAPGDLIGTLERVDGRTRQRTHPGGVIEDVERGSPADRLGITPGDILLSINGHHLRDAVDYQFYAADSVLSLELQRPKTGEGPRQLRLVKDQGQSLGITFSQPTFTPIRECNNHCPFCFIDQLPGEMRTSLYIRDDDYRYSFLYGNFVTLTNLNKRDWKRLREQHLSPLYVSVHATDVELRRLLLGNPRAPDVLAQLRRLAELGIRTHTQVVVCPGLNDGEALVKTVSDLAELHPDVLSIGVVPVGLTRTPAEILAGPGASCSRILPSAADLDLRQFTPAEAMEVIRLLRPLQHGFRSSTGRTLAYVSDEFYLLAGAEVPGARFYDRYPQYENGIGMVRDLMDDWSRTRRRLRSRRDTCGLPASVTFVSAEMAAPILTPMVAEWSNLVGIESEMLVLENSFFGRRVKVSGLLTGGDVLKARSRLRGEVVVLPEVMLDKAGQRLLDNMERSDLEERLDRPVYFAGLMSQVSSLLVPEARDTREAEKHAEAVA